MTDKLKIATVVVTYNRLELLKECITSLRNQTHQIDEIFVINNSSTDGTEEWLSDQNDLTTITQPNSGGAGGFYTGIKVAYEKGYDWIWLMDDDAEPELSALDGLRKNVRLELSAICPEVYDIKKKRVDDHRGMIKIDAIIVSALQRPLNINKIKTETVNIELTSFVGILINSNAISKIGYPIKEYFIHNDDIEYSLRLLSYGNIILVPEVIIFHKEENTKILIKNVFLGKQIYRIPFEQYWVKYFTFRNFYLVLFSHVNSKWKVFLSIITTTIKEIIQIILFDDRKYRRATLIIKATNDASKYRLIHNSQTIKTYLYSK